MHSHDSERDKPLRTIWPPPADDPPEEPFEPWARKLRPGEREREWPWKRRRHWLERLWR